MAENYTPTGATAAAIERFTAAEAATGTYGAMMRTFHTEIADRTRFLATTGLIAFPATQVASADANTLDDYEEGSFTPGLTFGGGSTGIAYTTNVGTYTKVGNIVHFRLQVLLSSKGSSTGSVRVTGMPFTSSSAITTQSLWANTLSFADRLQTRLDGASTSMRIEELTNAGTMTDIADTDFANTTNLLITGSYSV